MTQIKGKVAKVLNARELLINRGSDDGVGVGMRFAVLDPQAENVRDPDTGKPLGSISRPKVTVEVTQVEPHLSLAATYRKVTENRGGSGLGTATALSKVFQPPDYVQRYETFRSTEQTWEALPESQSYVKTGDPVVQLLTTQTGTGLAGAQITTDTKRTRPPRTATRPTSKTSGEAK